MAKAIPTDLPMHAFISAAEFEAFLDREHESAPGIYVKFAKKASGIASISASEAVEVALCFGWIDGRGNSIDDKWYCGRYTPRRAKSIWSQKNVATVGRLEEQGKMRPAGLVAVQAAKVDGRWDRAYAGPATITVPDDFAMALKGNKKAERFFGGLNKTERYAVLWRVHTASPTARANRIIQLVETLARGQVPGRIDTAVTIKKTKKTTATSASTKAVKDMKTEQGTADLGTRRSARLGRDQAKS